MSKDLDTSGFRHLHEAAQRVDQMDELFAIGIEDDRPRPLAQRRAASMPTVAISRRAPDTAPRAAAAAGGNQEVFQDSVVSGGPAGRAGQPARAKDRDAAPRGVSTIPWRPA